MRHTFCSVTNFSEKFRMAFFPRVPFCYSLCRSLFIWVPIGQPAHRFQHTAKHSVGTSNTHLLLCVFSNGYLHHRNKSPIISLYVSLYIYKPKCICEKSAYVFVRLHYVFMHDCIVYEQKNMPVYEIEIIWFFFAQYFSSTDVKQKNPHIS